ncbi:hypothetical protein QF042_005047 [Pedobacter sp. W3I1]|uniref:RagB/SusD family nutrient uptake outer membrane protein n=1 Tax=Pedobacter sp. W3I1 TaxID=3042291 RepID=UPI00277DE036|nr:RagB/SusD family nutrient uptake outer membrane protein [Pedobacter sp. W3I1]MDQ0641482.1 hypothetical protein [Pedobacter sp. W3I1]
MIFTRLEDIILLRAEALSVLGDQLGAINELVSVQARRYEEGTGFTFNLGTDDIIKLIFEERHRELLGEGSRWYDLIRYNKIKQNDAKFMNLINSGGIYWPISRRLISQNSLLTQNAYWR